MSNTQPHKRVITLYTESNPNPNALKFVADYMLMPEGQSMDFRDAASAAHAPLAKKLFGLPYVEGVFYMSNFVTVTKDENVDWYEVKNDVLRLIKEHLEANEPLGVADASEKAEEKKESGGLENRIIEILDEYIKPAVETDGGAISFHSYKEGKVKVLLQGSCSGCPSSTITLKSGIENLLKSMVPEVQEVEAEEI